VMKSKIQFLESKDMHRIISSQTTDLVKWENVLEIPRWDEIWSRDGSLNCKWEFQSGTWKCRRQGRYRHFDPGRDWEPHAFHQIFERGESVLTWLRGWKHGECVFGRTLRPSWSRVWSRNQARKDTRDRTRSVQNAMYRLKCSSERSGQGMVISRLIWISLLDIDEINIKRLLYATKLNLISNRSWQHPSMRVWYQAGHFRSVLSQILAYRSTSRESTATILTVICHFPSPIIVNIYFR
jgi:hypothetical protein